MDWWKNLSLKWKLQIGFFVVTAVTTLFNRFLAVYEMQRLIDLARNNNVADAVVALMVQERADFIFSSMWESALEFSGQFMIIGFVATLFVRPLQDLIRALTKVEEGDLTQRVAVRNHDEIGEVSEHFNDMVKRLAFVLANANGSATHMRQSAYQITEVSESIADQSEEEKRKFRAVSDVIEELNAIAEQIQTLAGESKQNAHQGQQAADVGKQQVQSSVKEMKQIEQRVQLASAQVAQLDETAQRIANQLFTKGQADHPYLGIHMVNITPETKQEINSSQDLNFKLNRDQGVVIVRVIPRSPAAKSGLQPGDIINKVGNSSVDTSLQVQEHVDLSEIGTKLPIEVIRDGRTETLEVIPSAFPQSEVQ